MAKARPRIKPIDPPSAGSESASPSPPSSPSPSVLASLPQWAVWCRRLAAASCGGLLVYTAHFPSDSVLVESGDALWFCAFCLLIWTLTLVGEPYRSRRLGAVKNDQLGVAFDVLVWILAAWMMIAAMASCPPGNLRQATNEAWVWVSAAALLSACRRLVVDRQSQSMALTLLCAVASGLSALALHQEWISLPATKALYLADPESVLRAAGIDAPPRSASRMIFANRLLDGGPTATFALANSLAAVLVVAVLVPLGILTSKNRRRNGSIVVMIGLMLLVVCAVAALFATRSRSALIACLMSVGWIWFHRGDGNQPRTNGDDLQTKPSVMRIRRLQTLWPALQLMVVIGTAATAGLLFFGDDEWIAAAPSSLEFRLQYWKSTARMLLDQPIFGCGPGGFQAMYLGYRMPIANESIADPHNFFVETLAAGGLPAALLLMLILWICLRMRRRDRSLAEIVEIDRADDGDRNATYMLWGGVGALVVIRLFSLLTANFIDFEAEIIATLVAVGAGWLVHSGLRGSNAHTLRVIGSGIVLAVMLHLSVSGGWTVPGVAIVVWVVAAMLCATSESCATSENDAAAVDSESPLGSVQRDAKRMSLVFLAVGITLLGTLRMESVSPVQEAGIALGRAEVAAQRGFDSRVETESKLAVDADPWAFNAALWRSEYLKSRLIGRDDDPQLRILWNECLTIALDRAGDHPIVRRAAGEQYLHLYQRFGRRQDLDDADRWIGRALQGNPTDLSLVAQAAMIAWAKADQTQAESLARQAMVLSKLGDNVVRRLSLQQILVVEPVGAAAAERPVLRSALDQFQDRLGLQDEPPPTQPRSTPTQTS